MAGIIRAVAFRVQAARVRAAVFRVQMARARADSLTVLITVFPVAPPPSTTGGEFSVLIKTDKFFYENRITALIDIVCAKGPLIRVEIRGLFYLENCQSEMLIFCRKQFCSMAVPPGFYS